MKFIGDIHKLGFGNSLGLQKAPTGGFLLNEFGCNNGSSFFNEIRLIFYWF